MNADLFTLKTPLVINYSFGSDKWHYSVGAGAVCSFTLSQNKEFVFQQFEEVYGKTIPNFLYGGIFNTSVDFKLSDNHILTAGVSYDSMINSGDVDEFTRLHFKTISFQAGIRF